MPGRKRLRSVCQSIAHHAVSGLSYVHPHVLRACRDAGVGHMQINLLEAEPCPSRFKGSEPLRLSLRQLREKFESILAIEGFSPSDLAVAELRFTPDSVRENDYCSTCRAILKSTDEDAVECVVNYLGQTQNTQPNAPGDAR